MKKTKLIFTSALAICLLSACATTSTESAGEKHTLHEKSAPKSIISVQKTPEEIFLDSLEGISVKKLSSPKEVSLGRTFSEPFVFSVTKADGTPADNFKLTLSYPASKTEGIIAFEKKEFITDAEGKVTFTAEKPAFSANTNVSAYPTPVSEDADLAQKLEVYTANAAWKVKSDLATKGAVLFVWDLN
jgi:hypothetical protein